MTTKVIVFDFDGTIADTYDTFVAIINRLADEFGYQPVSQEEIRRFRNLNSQEIIKQSGISLFKVPALLRRAKQEMSQEITKIPLITGIESALLNLQNQGKKLGIVTSNTQENVDCFLHNHALENAFDFVYSDTNIFGKHKIINKLIKQEKLLREKIIYVGDETRDITAAKKSNIKVIAVSWGFNSPEILAKCNPDFLIDNPMELPKIIADFTH